MVSLFFAFWGDLKILGVPRNLDEAVLIIFLSQITMNLVSKLLFPHVEPESADAGADCCLLSAPCLGGDLKGGLVYIILSFLVLFKALVISLFSPSPSYVSQVKPSQTIWCVTVLVWQEKSQFLLCFFVKKLNIYKEVPKIVNWPCFIAAQYYLNHEYDLKCSKKHE